ncbi:MAG: S1C family serine protease [Acidimicrobiales bacterium]
MSLLGDEGDEPEDRSRPLLPPDDRLWRHPSELVLGGSGAPGVASVAQPRRQRFGRPTLAAATGILLGAGLTAGAMLLSGSVTSGSRSSSLASGASEAAGTAGPAGVGRSAQSTPGAGVGPTVVTLGLKPDRPSAGPGSGASAVVASGPGGQMASVSPAMTAGARRARRSLVQIQADKGGTTLDGYGVEMTSPGVVLTTDSLVDGVDEVSVVDAYGNRLVATVIGTDPVTDVGVLRVEATTWSGIVVAGATPAVDQVVSALTAPNQIYLGQIESTWDNSDVPGQSPMLGALASDVPLPSGAVGAPLVDQAGQLVGMAGALGVGGVPVLAVPGSTASQAVESLLTTGAVPHGWLGVERAAPVRGGVEIQQLDSGAPAQQAGLTDGEVISEIDGQRIATVDDLWAAVRLRQPGTRISVGLAGHHGASPVQVTLGDLTGH